MAICLFGYGEKNGCASKEMFQSSNRDARGRQTNSVHGYCLRAACLLLALRWYRHIQDLTGLRTNAASGACSLPQTPQTPGVVKHMNIGEANRCLHCPGSRLVLIYKEAGWGWSLTWFRDSWWLYDALMAAIPPKHCPTAPHSLNLSNPNHHSNFRMFCHLQLLPRASSLLLMPTLLVSTELSFTENWPCSVVSNHPLAKILWCGNVLVKQVELSAHTALLWFVISEPGFAVSIICLFR